MHLTDIGRALSQGLFVTFLLSAITVSGRINSWTKPTSGYWEEPFWSRGVLPNRTHSVMITNSGWKAVAIGSSTAINFPDSMTVTSVTVRGAWDTMNTLLLNHAGTTVPLTVLNGVDVTDNARILNFHSALVVRRGTVVVVTNAQIIQDGGLVRTTNATMELGDGGQYHLTNGVFEGGFVRIGTPSRGHFYQYGGTAVIADLHFTTFGPSPGGYSLYGGILQLPGGLNLGAGYYFQADGTNRTPRVLMHISYGAGAPDFTLNGGLLAVGEMDVNAGYFGSITAKQNGGTHIITNALNLVGSRRNWTTPRTAAYRLNGGTLSARLIHLDASSGPALFVQSNGVTQAEQIQGGSVTLHGGNLSCSNLSGATYQYGGVVVVSNSLHAFYSLIGGTLTASNINANGWVVGHSAVPNRITNPGYFSLRYGLYISNAVEQLGRFILPTNAAIDLAGSASRLSFANSSGETWNAAATLIVTNWNGNPSGNGAEQLKFGTSHSGLTPAQLSQIRFVNPAGIPPGTYPAAILPTGEVVPSPRPVMSMTRSSNGIVISWSGNYQLYSSTNVAGPYTTINGATNPYTNSFNEAQRFFVLCSP